MELKAFEAPSLCHAEPAAAAQFRGRQSAWESDVFDCTGTLHTYMLGLMMDATAPTQRMRLGAFSEVCDPIAYTVQ